MKAYCSYIAGVLLFDNVEHGLLRISRDSYPAALVTGDGFAVLGFGSESPWPVHRIHHYVSLIDDWELVDGSDESSLLHEVIDTYWRRKAASYSQAVLAGLSDALERRVLAAIDDLLKTRVTVDHLVDELILAPFRAPEVLGPIVKNCLGENRAAAATLFDSLRLLQPHLNRLVSRWLEIPVRQFFDAGLTKEQVWKEVCRRGVIRQSLNSDSRSKFLKSWNSAVFDKNLLPNPQARALFATIGRATADGFFGDKSLAVMAFTDDRDVRGFEDVQPAHPRLTGARLKNELERVHKDIKSIIKAVAKGDDVVARRYRDQLIGRQLKFEGGSPHAVKSLCNIGKQCADLFRIDFERECLDEAMKLLPNDVWTLRQFADHLKRIGEFDGAIAVYERVGGLDSHDRAHFGIADVLGERREFSLSISRFKQIKGWESDPIVLTAIADNERRQGHLDEADGAYEQVLADYGFHDRALAGRADVAKRRGDFDQALHLYNQLLSSTSEGDLGWRIYSLAKCDVLKLDGQLQEALQVVEAVTRKFPFMLSGRVKKATILALLGRKKEALAAVPDGGLPKAYGEWVQAYYRGLLLCMVEEYEEAKIQLVDRLRHALADGDNLAIIRLGAAFAHLCHSELRLAELELRQVAEVNDKYTSYVADVLRLHLAVAKGDRERTSQLAEKIRGILPRSPVLGDVLQCLEEGKTRKARKYEVKLLLAMAPEFSRAA